jgi:hypothetical protein
MSTEDDLRRLGQTAAALAGVAAARAKQVAEQLLGPREKAREEAKHRAGSFVEEGRNAAADVVSALRREASVILRDLEHLEQNLRAREADDAGTATAPASGAEREGSDHLPATQTSPPKKAAKSAKAAPRKETSKPAKKAAPQVKKAAPQAKKAGGAKSASARRSTGGPGSSSSEGQG